MNYALNHNRNKEYTRVLEALAASGFALGKIDPKEDGSRAEDDLSGYWNIILNF